ncbi:hypothetical protein KIW84_023778 [Lathyrus oleraceus]|uniref:CobW C-terminal domain-containing protein n=1 Tax=Pisum sativum TaxID=3888 RepID=A0A9D4YHN5_PEA|nr:hypothetical protein KIW84_023778 [Pisum sativum]
MEHDEDEEPPLAVQIQRDDDQSISQQSSVGVTLITGYLGSGKSTLVNHILNSQHGKRIAVILNEFGEEIGVERALINEGEEGAVVEEWVELANGCVCCTVKHSLVQALEQLVQRKERLDHILLETTGLANPAPLASILWLDEQLESDVKLDSIVTVVDAKNVRFQLKEHRGSSSFPEAYFQIAFAKALELWRNSRRKSITLTHSSFNYIMFKPWQTRIWLEEILWEKKHDMDVYRCKGVLSVQNSDQLHTLQAVRELYEIVPARKWKKEENRVNKIVFIGHNLKEDVLISSLRALATC